MRTVLSALIWALLILVGATQIAHSEQGRGKDKQWERLEIITMWKMIEALDLDRATADKVMEIRHKFLTQRKEIKQALNQDLQKLRQLLKTPSADEAELARLITSVRDKRKELTNLHSGQYDEVSKILPVRKQAELILFLKDFQKELRVGLRQQLAPSQNGERIGRPHPPNGPPPGPGPLGLGRGDRRPPGPPPRMGGPSGQPGIGPRSGEDSLDEE
jgi:Spy/CpxP family protein refolding chaperone